MNRSENPSCFESTKVINGIEIKYADLNEISQGGPQVGKLAINGNALPGYFGGPALYENGYLYVPEYVQNFLGWGFKLVRISNQTLEVDNLGDIRDLIFLDKIENTRVYFFEDVAKTRSASLPLPRQP